MFRKSIDRIRSSLTVRIFFVTAFILMLACLITYRFLVWATPISYDNIVEDIAMGQAASLAEELSRATKEESREIIYRFELQNGVAVFIQDDQGKNIVFLPGEYDPEGPDKMAADDDRYDGTYVISAADASQEESHPGVAGDGGGQTDGGGLADGGGQTDGSRHEGLYIAVADDSGGIQDKSANYTVSDGFSLNPSQAVSYAASAQFLFKGEDDVYHVVLASASAPVNHTVQAMKNILPVLIIVILAISFLGALFYSRYITRPIVRLSGLSLKIAGLDFSSRSGESRLDEIGVLGRNLDKLSDQLGDAMARLQAANEKLQRDIDAERELERKRTEFFAAASHELKTPLTILSGQLAGMLDGIGVYRDREKYLPRSLSVVRRMEKLAGELLIVSGMEKRGGKAADETIMLSELVAGQVEDIAELALLRSQTIKTDIAPNIQIAGDKELIQRAVSNLLGNASLHSPEQSEIAVLLENRKLIVRNAGAHIPPEDLPRLFEPFYRVDASRNSKTGGSGMGLYLVKMILDRHGASCMINNTADGVEAIVEF